MKFSEPISAFLKSQHLPIRTESPGAVLCRDDQLQAAETFYLPGGHSTIRYKILAQCGWYCGREVVSLSCLSKFISVPPSLVDEFSVLVNEINKEEGRRSWVTYFGGKKDEIGQCEFRLTSVMYGGTWSHETFTDAFVKQIVFLNEQFNRTLDKFIKFFEKDRAFRECHERYERVERFLQQFTPHKNLQMKFVFDAHEAACAELKQGQGQRDIALFAEGIVSFSDVIEEFNIEIHGMVTCDLGCVEVRMAFLRDGKTLCVGNPYDDWRCLRMNAKLALGFYSIASDCMTFTLKSVLCCLEKRQRVQMVHLTVENALQIVRESLPSLVSVSLSTRSSLNDQESVPQLSDAARPNLLRVERRIVEQIQEKLPRKVYGEYLMKVSRLEDEVTLGSLEDAEGIKSLISSKREEEIREFFLRLAINGVFFRPPPLKSLYNVRGFLKLAPNFNPQCISKPIPEQAYRAAINSSLSALNTSPAVPFGNIARIDASFLSVQDFSDPLLSIQPKKMLFHNTLNSRTVLLRLIKQKAVTSAGRMMGLSHPNLARVYGYVEKDGYFLVRDKYEKSLLSSRDAPLPLKDGIYILISVASALSYLHQQGEFHLRLKPSNILLDKDDTAIVSDYGLYSKESEFLEERDRFSDPDLIARTCVVNREKADVWSFGLLMHYLLVSTSLFNDYQKKKVWDKKTFLKEVHRRCRRPLIREIFEINNPRLVRLMRICLFPDAEKRPSMALIHEQLSELVK